MIRKYYFSLRSKLYFIPSIYAILFIVLAVIIIRVDNIEQYNAPFLFLFTSRQLGSVILSTVVGCLLTMLTITFSIMMVVLTIYGAQLSPRTLQDFLGKKTTLRILGYFIGSLIFSIITLFAVKSEQYENFVLSPAVGVIFLIIAVFLFVYFIRIISKSIQVSLYIQNLVKDTAGLIDDYLKIIDDDPEIISGNPEEYLNTLQSEAWEITTKHFGFIQYYDERKILAFAKENNVVINCVNMIGEHVMAEEPILRIYNYSDKKREKTEELLADMVYIGDETNLYKDIGAGTKKLVEIAVRALSPGINDPNTAVFCIEQIGFLLQKAAKGFEAKVYLDDDKNVKVIVQGLSFKIMLFQHFYQIAHYASCDIIIVDAILGALINICRNNSYLVKEQVWAYSKYLIKKMNLNIAPEYEKKYIRERFYQLSKAAN